MGRKPLDQIVQEWDEKYPNKAAAVQAVFDHWVNLYRSNAKAVKLGPKRKRKIQQAVDLYGLEICMGAVTGVGHSPFHMGQNRNKKRYDDIELILRDEEKIERFYGLYEQYKAHGDVSASAQAFLND